MKLFVTGCLGFISSHFIEMSIKQGHEIVGLDLITYAGRKKNLENVDIKFYEGDICDAVLVSHILNTHQPDAIVHFAAESHVARSIENRDEFLRTNVGGTNVLLEESLKYWRGADVPFSKSNRYEPVLSAFTNSTVKDAQLNGSEMILPRKFTFLHVSTDEVYGSLDFEDESWTEQSPYAPNNPYSASKAASDHLVRAYNKTYGLPTIITHSANNYGSRQHPEKLIPLFISKLMRDEPLTIHGDGLNIRDWLHVDDHCRGLLDALEFGKAGETYNFGGNCERDNLQIANLLMLKMNKQVPIISIEDRAGNDMRYSTNHNKATLELGWFPRAHIEERISEVIDWYLSHQNYADDYGK